MALAISKFLMIVGPGVTIPSNMQELIPYLLNFFVAVVLVVCVFRLIGGIAKIIVNWRRF